MNDKKTSIKIVFTVSCLALLLAALTLCGNNNQGVTLLQAICITKETAQLWASDAEVAQVISTDAGDQLHTMNGNRGRRKCWNVLYVSQSKQTQYNVFLINGTIAHCREVQMPAYSAIKVSEEVNIDSTDALKIAKEHDIYPVKKSEGWAVGYHFALQYLTDITTNEVFLAMLVYGAAESNNLCYLAIDPISQDVISFMEQTGYSDDGRAIWTDIWIE